MSVTSDDTPKKSKTKKGDRNDPARFMDPGLSYRGKLIGVEDVQEPRGDKMCQVAMAKLKAAVKTIGDHKQKIVVNVSLDGIKIMDEKTECLVYFHPVHRISFISRDANDSRAFGYVFGAGGGSHQFYGIKTEKVAEGIVICLRDLFQVVFEMKKQENELNKRSHDVEDRAHNLRSFSSPKPTATRGSLLRSDYYSESPSPPSRLSTESCRSSATPVSVKKGVTGAVRQSPVLSCHQATPPKQGHSHLSHEMSRQTTTTPEPIYQNASVLAHRFPIQSTMTSSTPPASSRGQAVSLFAAENSDTPGRNSDGATGWVAFELDSVEKSSENASESRRRRKDPFANDPFFNRTSGSEEGGEVVILSQAEILARDNSADAKVEPIYGFFVEPDAFADFSSFDDESLGSKGAWVPMSKGVGAEVSNNRAAFGSISSESVASVGAFAIGPGAETTSDRESLSEIVSFPSPDAPPPPLPQNAPVLLGYQEAPVPPPRPGSSCSRFDPSTIAQGCSTDRWVECVPPALPSRPAVDSPRPGAGEIPPPPPPRSDLAATLSPTRGNADAGGITTEVVVSHPWKTDNTLLGATQDPFAIALHSKRSAKQNIIISNQMTSIQSAPKHVPSPIPSRNTSLLEDSTTTLCGEIDPPFSPSSTVVRNGAEEPFHDPFSSLDPFAAKDFRIDPFANTSADVLSSESFTSSCDPSGKRFSADSQAPATDSLSDDVFSSRDEPDEKSPASVGSNEHHRNGDREIVRDKPSDASNLITNSRHSTITAVTNIQADLPGPSSLESSILRHAVDSFDTSHATTKLNEQFDSVLDDFARRFPPFDDTWSMLVPENESRNAHPSVSVQPTGGATAGKSRLSIPKSSDSSSNSELAEAFGDGGNFSSNHGVKQQTKS